MKRNFVKTPLFLLLFSLFSSVHVFSQAQEKHPDSYYANSHVTGIGTSTIVYHLDNALSAQVAQDCQTYLSNYPRIAHAIVNSSSIILEFNEPITTNEQIYLFIQRLEMNYIYKQKKS